MESNPELADGVLEEVVRVLTLNSTGTDDDEEDVVEEVERKGWGKSVRVGGKLNGWFGKLKNKKNSKDQETRTTTTTTAAETSAADTVATNDDGGDGGVAARESVGGEGEDKDKDKDKAAASRGCRRGCCEGQIDDRRPQWFASARARRGGTFHPETEAAAAAAAAGVKLVVRPSDDEAAEAAAAADEAAEATAAEASGDTLGGATLTGNRPAVSVEARAVGMSYADWMRSVTTMAVEMEVNAQLGEFTVRKNRLKSLEYSVREMPDFTAALGPTLSAASSTGGSGKVAVMRDDAGGVASGGGGDDDDRSRGGGRGGGRGAEVDGTGGGADGGGAEGDSDSEMEDSGEDVVVHCAEVKRTEHRLWMRLVGLRHDVQLWDHDRRAPSNPFNRRYQPLFSNAQIAAGLAGAAGRLGAGCRDGRRRVRGV